MDTFRSKSKPVKRLLAGLLILAVALGLLAGGLPVLAAADDAVEDEKEILESVEEAADSEAKDEENGEAAEQPEITEAIPDTQEPEHSDAPGEAPHMDDAETDVGAQESEFQPPTGEEEQTQEEPTADGEAGTDEPEEAEEGGFAARNTQEQYAALKAMESEEEWDAAVASLSVEQREALFSYMRSLYTVPATANRTAAGPFRAPVAVQGAAARRNAPRRTAAGLADTEGIETEKTVTVNGDGSYTITLESYTTGAVLTQSASVPADIVLVLDVTGSMNSPLAGAASRIDALRTAAGQFVDQIHEKYSESCDSRLAIVTFADSAETKAPLTFVNDAGHSVLRNITDNLQVKSTHTQTDTGVERAEALITGSGYSYNGSNTQRSKVVIVFTDGEPYNGSNPYFDTASANRAVQAAYRIKSDGVTVYTVGVFDGANPAIASAADIPAGSGINKGTSTLSWNGTQYTVPWWEGDSKNAGLPQGYDRQISYSLVAPYNANIFCNYLSSNMPEASSLSMNGDGTLSNMCIRFRINPASMFFAKTSNDYYLTADNAAALENIFESISRQIESQDADLGSTAVVQDVVTPWFLVPDGADVKLYTAEKTESGWSERQEERGFSRSVDPDTGVLRVSGFDYNTNFVSEVPKENGSFGKKLIVEFTVRLPENFLGGSGIETNVNAWSGIALIDEEGNEQIVENFIPSPASVDVPLKKITPLAEERNIYLTTEDQLEELLNAESFTLSDPDGTNVHTVDFAELFDGINNEGVTVTFQLLGPEDSVAASFVIPAGEREGAWAGDMPMLNAESYTIRCIVADTGDSSHASTEETDARVRVFKPVLTYEDRNVYYKGTLDVSDIEPVRVQWKCGDIPDNAVTMHTAKPTLRYTYNLVDGTVEQLEDYTVGLLSIGVEGHVREDIDLLGENTADAVSFLRACEVEGMTNAVADKEAAFRIHVYAPTLAFADETVYYGEPLTLTPPTPTWENSEGMEAPASMDNTAPDLSVSLSPADGVLNENDYVSVREDFPVAASVSANGEDLTQALIDAERFTRTCETEPEHREVSTEAAFAVHVKTVSLTVSKTVAGLFGDKSAGFDFDVTVTPDEKSGLDTFTQRITLSDGGEQTFSGLPRGAGFSLTETEGPVNYEVLFAQNGGEAEKKDDRSFSGTLGEDETRISVYNRLETVPATGIRDHSEALSLSVIILAGMGLFLVSARANRKENRMQ